MYTGFLHLHDVLRWLLLISIVITLTKYLIGWLGKKQWTKVDNILGIVFMSIFDLQILIGLVLYFFLSPITEYAMSDFSGAMKDSELRFYAVEHFAMMLIAAILVHIGRAKSKNALNDVAKFRIASIFYLIALVLVVVAIPWSRI